MECLEDYSERAGISFSVIDSLFKNAIELIEYDRPSMKRHLVQGPVIDYIETFVDENLYQKYMDFFYGKNIFEGMNTNDAYEQNICVIDPKRVTDVIDHLRVDKRLARYLDSTPDFFDYFERVSADAQVVIAGS